MSTAPCQLTICFYIPCMTVQCVKTLAFLRAVKDSSVLLGWALTTGWQFEDCWVTTWHTAPEKKAVLYHVTSIICTPSDFSVHKTHEVSTMHWFGMQCYVSRFISINSRKPLLSPRKQRVLVVMTGNSIFSSAKQAYHPIASKVQ